MIPIEHVLLFATMLFAIGLVGLLQNKSLLRILLAIEAMLIGASFGIVGCAAYFAEIDGYVMFVMVLAVAASEVGIGLSILLHYDRLNKTLDITNCAEESL